MSYNTCIECKKPFKCKEKSLRCVAHTRDECLCSKCYANKQLGKGKLSFVKEKDMYRVQFSFWFEIGGTKPNTVDMVVDCWLITEEEKETFALEVL
jgi:hypothetical protein